MRNPGAVSAKRGDAVDKNGFGSRIVTVCTLWLIQSPQYVLRSAARLGRVLRSGEGLRESAVLKITTLFGCGRPPGILRLASGVPVSKSRARRGPPGVRRVRARSFMDLSITKP